MAHDFKNYLTPLKGRLDLLICSCHLMRQGCGDGRREVSVSWRREHMFVIPEAFVREMIAVHGPAGRAWIDRLPTILAACEHR
jgi:hypothetical protein